MKKLTTRKKIDQKNVLVRRRSIWYYLCNIVKPMYRGYFKQNLDACYIQYIQFFSFSETAHEMQHSVVDLVVVLVFCLFIWICAVLIVYESTKPIKIERKRNKKHAKLHSRSRSLALASFHFSSSQPGYALRIGLIREGGGRRVGALPVRRLVFCLHSIDSLSSRC